jgi:hypothetical protein
MLKTLYKKYFQKSKTFLFPAVGLKRQGYTQPEDIYLMWKDQYTIEDKRLIAVYKKAETTGYKKLESKIQDSIFYESTEYTPDGLAIYIFNLSKLTKDWNNFVQGKYSKLSTGLKRTIKEYFNESSKEYKFIDSYLYPELYFTDYSELLNVDINLLEEVGELCDKYDHDKETLVLERDYLEVKEKTV